MATAQVTLRALRYSYFPNDIFDEYAWDMVLHLYIARLRERTIHAGELIDLTSKNRAIGDRWIRHLAAEGMIVVDGDAVSLSDGAFEDMEAYYRQALAANS